MIDALIAWRAAAPHDRSKQATLSRWTSEVVTAPTPPSRPMRRVFFLVELARAAPAQQQTSGKLAFQT